MAHLVFVNGQVVGGWKRSIEPAKAVIRLELLKGITRADHERIAVQARRFGRFIGAASGTMTSAEAIELIRPGVPQVNSATWVDFGAGRGTFTEALAELLMSGRVIAVDRDANLVHDLQRLSRLSPGVTIEVALGDMQQLESIPLLLNQRLDGALFANVLHYVEHPEAVLSRASQLLKPHGRIIVIEYDRRGANHWVPNPLPFDKLVALARDAGLNQPVEIGRRPSGYQGDLYCALIEPPA